jgi:hypothetical protein
LSVNVKFPDGTFADPQAVSKRASSKVKKRDLRNMVISKNEFVIARRAIA